jgi:hypothetical protein
LNLNSVSVSSNSNAWMLGTNGALAGAAHWNGHHFTVTQIPVPANSTLRAIATTGAKETWVVGTSEVTKGSKSLSKILAMHWNGTKWSRVKTPSPYPNSYPMAITASGKHVYIAGSGGAYSNPKGFDQHAFVLSLKGQRWKSQHVASVGVTSSFTSVSTSSKASVAVGASYNGYVCGGKVVTTSPLAESRHGTSWGRESAPKLRFGTPQHRPWSATPLARSC